jgi:protein-S-isoprenylcysteine O-methyltransferase Ste14
VHKLAPGGKLFLYPWNILGGIPLFFGIIVNLLADQSFKDYKTSVKPQDKSTTLITDGAFRISRHPMYLGFALILFGLSILLGSLTPHIIVIAFIVFMDEVFIKFEEKKLALFFGQEWRDYKKSVRRWI